MTSVRDIVCEAKVANLHSVLEQGGNRYVCFTSLSNSNNWVVATTDGCDLWRLELDSGDLEDHRDLAEVTTVDTFLSRVRSAFVSGDIQVTLTGTKLNLRVGQGNKTVNFDLYEAKAIEKRTELSSLLFRLAESSSELEAKLEKSEKTIAGLRQQKDGGTGGGLNFDLDKKKKGGKAAPRQAGMSAINPSSKKRKAAAGVQFD